MQQEEGVLKDVLDELDRERTRRAELELTVHRLHTEHERLLESQRLQQERTASAESAGVSYAAFMALQAEVEGYRQLIHALTVGKPAIGAAAQAENIQAAIQNKRTKKMGLQESSSLSDSAAATTTTTLAAKRTLPLHVVRLLEVLPWEPRTQQHVVAIEQIYEWQVYKDHHWQSHMKYFPVTFKTLRLVKASSSTTTTTNNNTTTEQQHQNNAGNNLNTNHNSNNALMQILSGAELQKRNKQRILTDESITVLYDTDAGFPLPPIKSGGVWEWIGSWRVVKGNDNSDALLTITAATNNDNNDVVSSEAALLCDENGWTYVENPRDFLLVGPNSDKTESKLFCDAGFATEKKLSLPQRIFRRRKWVRQRNLVDYPFASEYTRQYLRLLADNACQQIVTAKINDQLIQTKANLTEAEERLAKGKNNEHADSSQSQSSEQFFELNNDHHHNHHQQQHHDDTKKLEEELIGGETYSSSSPSFSNALLRSSVFERNPMDKLSLLFQQHHNTSSSTRKVSEDITLSDDSGTEDGLGTDSTHSDSTSTSKNNNNFDWKKLGPRGAQLMQKLKTVRGAGGGNSTTVLSSSSFHQRAFRHGGPVLVTANEEDDLML